MFLIDGEERTHMPQTIITLSFQLPKNDAIIVGTFARDMRKLYNAQIVYYSKTGIVEVSVEIHKMQNVIHAAMARNFILLQG